MLVSPLMGPGECRRLCFLQYFDVLSTAVMSITFGTIISDWQLVVRMRGTFVFVAFSRLKKMFTLFCWERHRASQWSGIIFTFIIYRKSASFHSLSGCLFHYCSVLYSGWFWVRLRCRGASETSRLRKWRQGTEISLATAPSGSMKTQKC